MDSLYINNMRADLGEETINLKYENNLLGTIGEIQSSYSYNISIPKTTRNMKIFQLCNSPSKVYLSDSIIGEYFPVRYRKRGIDILGDTVGYLESVTEDAFNIYLSFGFLGAIGEWLNKGGTLNDLGDYTTNTTVFNNLIDDYPQSGNIEDLPNIFKPYYDCGVAMNPVSRSMIARLPVVPVRYLIEQIELKNQSNCKFLFPDDVKEQINSLVIPLISKKTYIGETSIKPIVTADSIGATDDNIRGKTLFAVSGISSKYVFPVVEGVYDSNLQTGITVVNGLPTNVFGVSKLYLQDELSTYCIIPENDMSFGITLNTEFYVVFDEWKEDQDVVNQLVFCDILENGAVSVLKNYSCSAKRDDMFVGTYSIIPEDKGINFFNLKAGHKYAFLFFLNFKKDDKVAHFNPSTGKTPNGEFWFNHKKGMYDIDFRFYKSEIIQAKGNLPDISQVDFIQSLCNMFGLFPIVNPVPKKDEDTGKKVIELVSIDTLFKNKVSRYVYGKKFNDWTDRLITDPNDIEVSFSKEGYYQRNYLRYAEDDTVTGDHDGYFDISDKKLDKEGVLTELPFAASDGDRIPMYKANTDSSGNTSYSFESFEPRIMSVTKRADGKCGLTFDGLDFKSLLSKYYNRYIELVRDMYLITVTVELNALDLKNIDYTYPVYFKQFGRYFGIVDIQANSDDDNCEVTLLRLSAG